MRPFRSLRLPGDHIGQSGNWLATIVLLLVSACGGPASERGGVYSETRDFAEVEAGIPLLAAHRLDLYQAIGVDDLGSPALLSLVRECAQSHVGVRAWVLLPRAQGYWPGETNVDAFGQAVDQVLAWIHANDVAIDWVTFDLEPDVQYTMQLVAKASETGNPNSQLELVDLVRTHEDRAAFLQHRDAFQAIVDRVHAAGLRAHAVTYPVVLDDLADGDPDLEDGFDIPVRGISWDEVSLMVYRSTWQKFASTPLGSALFYSYAVDLRTQFGAHNGIDFGVIGTDAFVQGSGYTDVGLLAADVAATRAAGVSELHLYDLASSRASGTADSWLAFAQPPATPATTTAAPPEDPAVDQMRGLFLLLDGLLDGP